MLQEQKDIFWKGIIPSKGIKSAIAKRLRSFITESIPPQLLEVKIGDAWEIDKQFQNKVRIKKLKSTDVLFEDEVWSVIASMGFDHLNSDRNFRLPYSEDFTLTQQIDVFAADKEVILIIECKATDGEPKKGNFKETI